MAESGKADMPESRRVDMPESGLNRLHALAILEYAERRSLSDVYQRVWTLVSSGQVKVENVESGELRRILEHIPPGELEDVLKTFLELARGKMKALPVEIISAVPLTQEQLYKLQVRLIRLLRKQLDVTTSVDPSLLGGVRILVENAVIDYSVKRRLSDLKEVIYKGVYQANA